MSIDRETQERRRRALVQLLTDRPMRRQMDITQELRDQGFQVTQSSVSRDLEALGIERKNRIYVPPAPKGDDTEIEQMAEFIREVRTAGPYLLIFDTDPGTAPAVAAALRKAEWPEVRGVLAEDDSLFVAVENAFDSRLLMARFKRVALE